MHALFGQGFDNLQAEPAQLDAGACKVWIVFDQTEDVARCRIAVHAEQKIGGRKIEKAQSVRLEDLGAVDQFAQQLSRRRYSDRHDGIACLGRRQLMADRANTADARGDTRHFVIGAAFYEFLKSADLCHLKLGVGDRSAVVELKGDLAVALDASDRFNGDAFHPGS
jgi:hypothetical protein